MDGCHREAAWGLQVEEPGTGKASVRVGRVLPVSSGAVDGKAVITYRSPLTPTDALVGVLPRLMQPPRVCCSSCSWCFCQMVVVMGSGRGVAPETVRRAIDEAPLLPSAAAALKLLDGAKYRCVRVWHGLPRPDTCSSGASKGDGGRVRDGRTLCDRGAG